MLAFNKGFNHCAWKGTKGCGQNLVTWFTQNDISTQANPNMWLYSYCPTNTTRNLFCVAIDNENKRGCKNHLTSSACWHPYLEGEMAESLLFMYFMPMLRMSFTCLFPLKLIICPSPALVCILRKYISQDFCSLVSR